jgi:hypothetical protein
LCRLLARSELTGQDLFLDDHEPAAWAQAAGSFFLFPLKN